MHVQVEDTRSNPRELTASPSPDIGSGPESSEDEEMERENLKMEEADPAAKLMHR